MDKNKISHDILNTLERLRIMHDLVLNRSFEQIGKEELLSDLKENMEQLQKDFEKLAQ